MFVRIMAPLTQSEKFDAAGYIREWVPELADLSDADIHDPPSGKRPKGYPDRLIEHRDARERALSAWQQAKGS
jgi:deoxyribodipyrimidine photo-lyase